MNKTTPINISENSSHQPIAIIPVMVNDFPSWLNQQDTLCKNLVQTYDFGKSVGSSLCLPDCEGRLQKVICIISDNQDYHNFARLPDELPQGEYFLQTEDPQLTDACIIGWGMGSYFFDRYKQATQSKPVLIVSDLRSQHPYAYETVCATYLVRDLINTPADHMGPTELSQFTKDFSEKHSTSFDEIIGEELLEQNFPAVHLIGRASFKAPRLLTMEWGKSSDPLVCLVGKGVCFDTGGNNVKPANGMRNMKKDMGGAAHVLGLAQLIIRLNLPVRLKIVIPAVENAISGNAHRQGDIVTTRKGLTVEIGHTDAEGRMILSDALTYASEANPDLIIDFATLTGAARVALGADVPPVFSNENDFNTEILSCSNEVYDPLWPMPLYQPYKKQIVPDIADLSNTGSVPMGGCITAALFLQEFVGDNIPWVHIDTFGWSLGRVGHPKGGEALGMLAMFNWISKRFGV